MNIKEIKEMLQLMAEHGLNEVEIEKDGLKLRLKKGPAGQVVSEVYESVVRPPQAIVDVSAGRAAQPESPKIADPANVTIIKSPMVGTFYSAPGPDQPAYAAIGKQIKDGDVLCIIEAMKLMNEIKSEVGGKIIEILVKNGQPVEFDQPLFKVQKN